jgi:hypothetical protein
MAGDELKFNVKTERAFHDGRNAEVIRCADIALEIWEKQPVRWQPWYKKVGQEIAAEILGVDQVFDFMGIQVRVDPSLEPNEVVMLVPE